MWGKSAPSKTPPLLFSLRVCLSLSCFGVVFAETIVSQRRWKWFHAFSLEQPEMDVRFYPAPPANVGSCSLPTDPSCLSSLDYYHSNKVNYKLCALVHWNGSCLTCLSLCEPKHNLQHTHLHNTKRMLRTHFIHGRSARSKATHSLEKMSSVSK